MRRRRVSPFLLIAFAILLVWFGYLAHQLVALSGLDLTIKVLCGLVLAAPFGAVFWLPLFHWQDEDPTPAVLRPFLAKASHFSLGYLSLLLFAVALRDAVWAGTHDARLYAPLGSAATLLFAGALFALGVTFAHVTPHVRRVRVPISGLPPALDGYRIVQLSDMHIGATMARGLVPRVVARANELEPDLVALTGDIFEGDVPEITSLIEPLKDLRARDGAVYVTGNHEYYWGVDQWIAHVPKLGLKQLRNSHLIIERGGAKLVIAGIDDVWASGQSADSLPAQSLAGAPTEVAARVLLSHQPKIAPIAATLGFSLQLSGHTHGGQFLPWVFFAPLVHGRLFAGLSRVGSMWTYVSRGTGSWGPLVRLGAPTEITLLTLSRG